MQLRYNELENYKKELVVSGIRCLQSESARAVLLNEQAMNKAIIIELQNRFTNQSIPSVPIQLPFTKPVTVKEFPPKNTVFSHISPESQKSSSPHMHYMRRHNTISSHSERTYIASVQLLVVVFNMIRLSIHN